MNTHRRRNFRSRQQKNNFRRRNGTSNPSPLNSMNNNGNKNFARNGSMNNIHSVEKAMHKFQQLAKDAQSSGDPVLAENYLQHADHYTRRFSELSEKNKDQSIEKSFEVKKAVTNEEKQDKDLSQSVS